ncbi:MAG: 50S ribosomal protein L18 [Bacteroidota bacterium]
MSAKKLERRKRIRARIRSRISGTAEKPRLAVFRSNKEIYAQIIDDESGHTLVSCSSRLKALNLQAVSRKGASHEVGKKLAEMAKSKGINTVIFDRGGYKYHGRVKALAEGAREGGLNF